MSSTIKHTTGFSWLKRVVKALVPHAVFFRDNYLLMLIHQQNQVSKDELLEKCEAQRLPKTIQCAVLFTNEIYNDALLSNLFFLTLCTEEHCIYKSRDDLQFIPRWQVWRNTRTRALQHFENGMRRSRHFYQGAGFFWATGNYPMATFMLHQSAELCLRCVIRSIKGREVRSHNVRELITLALSFVPRLKNLHPIDSDADSLMWEVLDRAYIDVRYGTMEEECELHIDRLLVKIKAMHVVVEGQMRKIFEEFDV